MLVHFQFLWVFCPTRGQHALTPEFDKAHVDQLRDMKDVVGVAGRGGPNCDEGQCCFLARPVSIFARIPTSYAPQDADEDGEYEIFLSYSNLFLTCG